MAIVAATYSLHFAEMGQAPLFVPMDRLLATSGSRTAAWDVAIGASAYFAAAVATRQVLWTHESPRWPFAIHFAVGLITFAIERWATSSGRWRYREAMPTIAEIGLTPLLRYDVRCRCHATMRPSRSVGDACRRRRSRLSFKHACER